MIDITKLKVGDVFYRVLGYEFIFKLEIVEEYDATKNLLLVKRLDGVHMGRNERIEPCYNEEGYYDTYDAAVAAYNDAEIKRLEYLSDVNNLIDELFKEMEGNYTDKSNTLVLYKKAIKQFKKKQYEKTMR